MRVYRPPPARRGRVPFGCSDLREQGLKTIVVTEWIGFFMRAGTSEALVSKASDAIAKALRQPDLVKAFASAGLVSAPSTPTESRHVPCSFLQMFVKRRSMV